MTRSPAPGCDDQPLLATSIRSRNSRPVADPAHRSPEGSKLRPRGIWHPAFTLLEVLVVVAIIGVLAGLLLPAVQAARESSRRTYCANNISNLAKGMIQHEVQTGFFPSGGWSSDWIGTGARSHDAGQPGGWTFTVLPFIEASTQWESVTALTPSNAQAAYTALVTTGISTFSCPSRRTAKPVQISSSVFKTAAGTTDITVTVTDATRCDYAANGGSTAACPGLDHFVKHAAQTGGGGGGASIRFAHIPPGNSNNCQELTLPLQAILNGHAGHADDRIGGCPDSNGACPDLIDTITVSPQNLADGDAIGRKTIPQRLIDLSDKAIPDIQDGIIARMSRLRPAAVLDGLSNTYLLGEKYVAQDTYETGTDVGDRSILYAGYSMSNIRWADASPAQDEVGVPRSSAYGSAHSGGWNAAFCDGSIRMIGFDIDPDVHRNLSAKSPRYPGEVLNFR